MPWDRSKPTDPKYTSRAHRQYRAMLVRQLKAEGSLICTARVCLFASRLITNPDGNAHDGLTAGHADNGVDYDGPQHRACNLRDGAVRGVRRRDAPKRWVL